MAHITYLIFLFIIEIGFSTEEENIQDPELQNIDLEDYIEYNKTDIYDAYNITEEIEKTNDNRKKCKVINTTTEDGGHIPENGLNSIDLDNIHSSLTSNLIKENLSVDTMELEGVNLFDIVNSDCGGAKVCPNVSGNWTNEKAITVGFLGAYGRSQTVLGAMPVAVAAINREPSLLPGLKLRFVAADIGRSRPHLPMDKDSLSLRVMTQMRDLGVVAFFGPDGTCHTEAKLAAAWNLPLISHKCAGAHGSFEKGSGLGATFARTLPAAYKASKSVIALLKAFGWTKFAIVAGDELTAAGQQMDAIKELAQSNDMVITAEHRFADYIPKHISDMERIVDQTYDKTRVYVFLGEHIALVDFMKVLQRRDLLTTGEYAVVAVDDEIYDPSIAAITHAEYLGQNSSDDVVAFRAVLRLTPSLPTNPHYEMLCQMIRKMSAAPPFCVPNYHMLFDTAWVPIEAAHLYDAVILWARAATVAMRSGLPPTDGATLMKLLRPTTYRSVQGFDVTKLQAM